jgi:hypothetical protein
MLYTKISHHFFFGQFQVDKLNLQTAESATEESVPLPKTPPPEPAKPTDDKEGDTAK